jgi:hypothetical protein
MEVVTFACLLKSIYGGKHFKATTSKNSLFLEAIILRSHLCKCNFEGGHAIWPVSKNSGPNNSYLGLISHPLYIGRVRV